MSIGGDTADGVVVVVVGVQLTFPMVMVWSMFMVRRPVVRHGLGSHRFVISRHNDSFPPAGRPSPKPTWRNSTILFIQTPP